MNPDYVVVDANIAFQALVSQRGDLRDRLDPSANAKFFTPAYLFVELFKHKTRLARATGLTEDELLLALHALVSRLEFVNEANISLSLWMEAHRLCKDVDEQDTPYVALTLHLDGRLWTEDAQLKQALRAKGFNNFYEP
jgi:predicted nucleic acid-binding protein